MRNKTNVFLIVLLITTLMIGSFMLSQPKIVENKPLFLQHSVVEEDHNYNSSGAGVIIGSQSETYTKTFLKDVDNHTLIEGDIGSGYEFDVMYGFNIDSFNFSDILRFEFHVYYQNDLSESCNFFITNNTSSNKELLTTDSVSSFHWKNMTFSPNKPSDYIDESSSNLVRFWINDTIDSGDVVSNNISVDYLQLVVVIDLHDITDPVFSSYPSNVNYEEGYQSAEVSWMIEENNPSKYDIYRNGTNVKNGTYANDTAITCQLNTTESGLWNYTIFINDTYDNNNTMTFYLTVDPSLSPSLLLSPNDIELEWNSTNYLTWRFNEKYPDKYVIYVNGTPKKDGSYTNDTDITILVNTSESGVFEYRIVVNDTTNNSNEHIVIVTIKTSGNGGGNGGFNPFQLIILLAIVVSISLSAGIVIMVVYTKRKSKKDDTKKKYKDDLQEKYDEYLDIKKIREVMLIKEDSSLTLAKTTFGEELSHKDVDGSMMSGFLSAIDGLGREISIGAVKKMKFEGYDTLVTRSKLIRFVVFLSDEPSKKFEDKIQKFTEYYENKYKEQIFGFNGNIASFRTLRQEIIDYFNMSLLKKHELILTLKRSFMTQRQSEILNICKRNGLELNPRTFDDIIRVCKNAIDLSESEVYDSILGLRKLNVLNPVGYVE